MGPRVPRIVLLCVAAPVTVAAFALAPPAFHDLIAFGTLSAGGAPPRVDYCGRRYYPAQTPTAMTRAQVDDLLAADGLHGLSTIDTAPSGMPVVANVMSPEVQARYHTQVCAMVVWVQTGANTYVPYGLSGGP